MQVRVSRPHIGALLSRLNRPPAMTPDAPWQPGRYELIALGILEDLAGNRIGRAFEIVGASDKGEDDAAVTARPFTLAR